MFTSSNKSQVIIQNMHNILISCIEIILNCKSVDRFCFDVEDAENRAQEGLHWVRLVNYSLHLFRTSNESEKTNVVRSEGLYTNPDSFSSHLAALWNLTTNGHPASTHWNITTIRSVSPVLWYHVIWQVDINVSGEHSVPIFRVN